VAKEAILLIGLLSQHHDAFSLTILIYHKLDSKLPNAYMDTIFPMTQREAAKKEPQSDRWDKASTQIIAHKVEYKDHTKGVRCNLYP